MIKFFKTLFGSKPAVEAQPEAVPYKVETPAPTVVAEQASQAVVESIKPAKKPAAKKASAPKKPRAPKKPKAE
jgi:hypothetical protein